MPRIRHHGVLALLLCLLALIMPGPAAAQGATAQSSCTATIHAIDAARETTPGVRPDVGWEPVAGLPDNWETRWPGHSGAVWYRIGWQRSCAPGGAVALTLDSMVMAGEVFVNDALLWRDARLTEPLSRSWNLPRYGILPEAMLRPGANALWVRVVGVAGQTPGLGPLTLGDPILRQQQYDTRWWQNRTLFKVNLIVSATLAVLFFFIWVIRREQRVHGWFALTALCWVLFVSNVLATTTWPFPDTLAVARFNTMALVLYIVSFCIFTWRFGGQTLPRLERALWLAAAAQLALLAGAPSAWIPALQGLVVLATAVIFVANGLQFQWHAWRTRQREHLILALALLASIAACTHDLMMMKQLVSGPAFTPYTSLIVMICMSAVLGLRHARGVRRIERYNADLAEGIAQARTQLASTLAREHTLALANAGLRERLTLAQDLHDGLGGSLVRMMALTEQAREPLSNPQFLSMLKLLRDDLRQTIDSGASASTQAPETPGEWAAPLRHRFVRLFDELGLDSRWTWPPRWLALPSALQCLALNRLVEESLTNVIKHARARHVRVTLTQTSERTLILEIEDDGVGFDVAAVRAAGLSVGMRSMHDRIAKAGGTLEIASAPGRTHLRATLALARPAP